MAHWLLMRLWRLIGTSIVSRLSSPASGRLAWSAQVRRLSVHAPKHRHSCGGDGVLGGLPLKVTFFIAASFRPLRPVGSSPGLASISGSSSYTVKPCAALSANGNSLANCRLQHRNRVVGEGLGHVPPDRRIYDFTIDDERLLELGL